MREINIVPLGDLVSHEPGEACVCGPSRSPLDFEADDDVWRVLHRSLDGREDLPRGDPEAKPWRAVLRNTP